MRLVKRCKCGRGRWPSCAHNWNARFKAHGKLERESTGTRDRAAAEVIAAKLRLTAGAPKPPRGQRATLAQVSAADIARAEGEQVTALRIESLERLWRHVLRHFGESSDPADLNRANLEAYVHARRAAGSKGQSVRRELEAVKRGLRIAAERGWIDRPPLFWPKVKSDPPRRAQAGKWHPLEVIRDWLDAMDPLARLHARCVADTGLRAEEMARGEVDWLEGAPPGIEAAAVVRLPAAASKTRRERLVPVSWGTADNLLTYWAYPDRPQSHKSARETARRAIGYGQRITLRDLRHTFASLAEQLDRKAAQDLLGHATERMTQRYLHSTPARLAGTALAVQEALGGGTRPGAQKQARSAKYGGRKGIRTPDPVRVSRGAPSDYSNLRSIDDDLGHARSTGSDTQGAQRGHGGRSSGG